MDYRGYTIEPEPTGYGQRAGCNYYFALPDNEGIIAGWGESVEDCKQQINQLLEDHD